MIDKFSFTFFRSYFDHVATGHCMVCHRIHECVGTTNIESNSIHQLQSRNSPLLSNGSVKRFHGDNSGINLQHNYYCYETNENSISMEVAQQKAVSELYPQMYTTRLERKLLKEEPNRDQSASLPACLHIFFN
jgi:hypothetical protein